MKLARTVRLDASDANIFPLAAEEGEWAVTGTFAFVDNDPAKLDGKARIAFKSGWLGLSGFGRATLVQVCTASKDDYEAAVRTLAGHLFSNYGAPDMLAALEAARHEVDDMAKLCDHPAGTLLAIGREAQADGIAEQLRMVKNPDDEGNHARLWEIEAED